MSRKWVINASPLIVLAKVSHLFLIEELPDDLVIPAGAAREIDQGPVDDPARIWLRDWGTSQIKVVDQIDPRVTAWDLGAGETQVIAWAYKNKDYEAILDDRAARKCAASFGIKVRGTLGIILLAKKESRISKARPVFEKLIESGLRIDPDLMMKALQTVGE